MKKTIKKHWIFITLFLLIIVSSGWLVFEGLPYQHDFEFHYSRMVSLANTIMHGDFMALVHDSFYGYGYALGIFYGNLFFYIPALLCIIGIPKIIAFKLLYVFINIGTVIITYFSLKGIIKNKNISVFITILYCFSEYRLFDIFVRGALGEALAFMVAPLVMLGLYEIIYGDYKKWYLFSIGFILLLLSHLITTVLMAFFCIIILLFSIKQLISEKVRIKYLIFSGVVGILIGAFFLFPILEQYLLSDINIFTVGSVYMPVGSSIFRLIIPELFFSCYLGISIIMLIPIRLFLRKKDIDKKYYGILSFSDLLLVLGVLVWICTTNIFPWKTFGSILSFIQFPWRLLFFATLFISISIGITIYLFLKSDYKNVVNTIFKFIVIVSFATVSLYSVQFGIRKNHYVNLEVNEIGNGEYLLSNSNLEELKENKFDFISNNSDLQFDYVKEGTTVSVTYNNNLQTGTYIEIPLFNYLGYKIEPSLKISNGTNDFIRVYLKDVDGSFKIHYDGTFVQKISYIISIISILSFVSYLIISHKKSN